MFKSLEDLVLKTLEFMKQYGYDENNPDPFRVMDNYLSESELDLRYKFNKHLVDEGRITKLGNTCFLELPCTNTFSQEICLAHEMAHLFLWENSFFEHNLKKIGGSINKIQKYEKYNFTEHYCELFARFFMFPPEDISSESKNDLLYLTKEKNLLKGIINLGDKRRMTTKELLKIFDHSKIFKDAFPNHFFINVELVDSLNNLKKIRSKNESLFLDLNFKQITFSSFFSNIFPENFKLYDETRENFKLKFSFRHKCNDYIYVNMLDNLVYYDTDLVYTKDENIHNFKVSKLTFFRDPLYRYVTEGYPKVENLFGKINYGFDKPLNISLFHGNSNNSSSSYFKEAINIYGNKMTIMGKIDLNSGSPLKNISKNE